MTKGSTPPSMPPEENEYRSFDAPDWLNVGDMVIAPKTGATLRVKEFLPDGKVEFIVETGIINGANRFICQVKQAAKVFKPYDPEKDPILKNTKSDARRGFGDYVNT